jgi:hypothetical protein
MKKEKRKDASKKKLQLWVFFFSRGLDPAWEGRKWAPYLFLSQFSRNYFILPILGYISYYLQLIADLFAK